MPALIAALAFVLIAGPACAHDADTTLTRWGVWTFDPWIAIPLILAGVLYVWGAVRLLRRARESRPQLIRRAAAYAAGWLTLVGALLSPLHWLGERLFTFHMIEHEILMAVSAPLIVIARPVGALLWSLPDCLRLATGAALRSHPARVAWDWMTQGSHATFLHGFAIWIWHAPLLFDGAVTHVALHRLQHLSFFATGVLFWWSVLWRSERGVATWHLFLTMLHTAILGALMALSPRVLYVAQTRAAADWGLTPLEDQQLAGMMMWIPAGTIYVGAALAMAMLWIVHSNRGPGHVRHIESP